MVIASYPQRAKVRNLRADPRASLLVVSDDWDDYRAAMTRQGKCLIRVTPERWGPIATGGFPP